MLSPPPPFAAIDPLVSGPMDTIVMVGDRRMPEAARLLNFIPCWVGDEAASEILSPRGVNPKPYFVLAFTRSGSKPPLTCVHEEDCDGFRMVELSACLYARQLQTGVGVALLTCLESWDLDNLRYGLVLIAPPAGVA